jgi:zinc protease
MSASALLVLALAGLPGAPVVGPAPKFVPPTPVVRPLASGARAWVVSRPGLPLVHVAVCVTAGSVADPQGKAGLAQLTAMAIEEGGAGDKTPAEVLATFDAQGTELEVRTDDVCTTFAFTVLAPRLEPTLRQLVDLLARPRFEPAAFESVKKRQLAEISQALDEPRLIASAQLRKRLYGELPAGHPARGDTASVSALTVEDVKKFHTAHYAPPGVTFVLVGEVTVEGAQKLLDGMAPKAWLPGTSALTMALPAKATPSWVGIDRPGLAQTTLSLGRVGVLSTDATVPALELAATVLGGSFTSRLNQNLREKHGYTYGASARVSAGRLFGSLGVGTAVRADVTGVALREALNELRGLQTLSADELAKAKALADSSLVGAFESGAAAAATFVQLVEVGLPPDDLARASARSAAVTQPQAIAAAASFDPAEFVVVLVGDRAKVGKQLEQAFPGHAITWVTAP